MFGRINLPYVHITVKFLNPIQGGALRHCNLRFFFEFEGKREHVIIVSALSSPYLKVADVPSEKIAFQMLVNRLRPIWRRLEFSLMLANVVLIGTERVLYLGRLELLGTVGGLWTGFSRITTKPVRQIT